MTYCKCPVKLDDFSKKHCVTAVYLLKCWPLRVFLDEIKERGEEIYLKN